MAILGKNILGESTPPSVHSKSMDKPFVFKIVEFLIVALIAFLQFTRIFNYPYGKWIIAFLAMALAVCLITSEVLQRKTEREKESRQEERDRKLAQMVIAEYKASLSNTIIEPMLLQSTELSMSGDDPRIYLDIEKTGDPLFINTPVVISNSSKEVAHTVCIQSFKLKGKEVSFPSVEVVSPGDKKNILPEIQAGGRNQNNIFHWLLQDWDGNGEMVEEWPKPLTANYSDFSKKKQFMVTMTLVFFPIRYLLSEKHNRPARRPLWELRNIEFKRIS
jgi:hypothetical protein